ncbi:MAG TPA: hypothetical protein DIS96_05955 [Pusillimonas sp.]|nr:hypothetical protein [Pusillimonas sp.]|tara:strand:- start:815 stop:1513 length:699 start_codon:yes stop_codon:yes gene_type:complete
MAFADLDGLTLKNVEQDLLRNIVSLRQGQDLFDDLSDNPQDWDSAINLELALKPPFYESEQPIIDRPFEDAAHFSAIQFPFDHIGQSRFSAGKFGVWYGSESLETTVYETVYHWQNTFLADAGLEQANDVTIERRVHNVRCDAALVNLVPIIASWPQLTANDYDDCQLLGAKLHRQGHPGIWTRSARCDGTNAAVFTPGVLSNPRDYCYLTYHRIDGRVDVYRDPGQRWFSI